MAPRVTPAPIDADNHAGSRAGDSTLARCNDWRLSARRFHVGTGHRKPTHDAGYTTAGAPVVPELSISFFPCGGSPYRRGWASYLATRPRPAQTRGSEYVLCICDKPIRSSTTRI